MDSALRRDVNIPPEKRKVPLRVTLLGETYEILGDVDPEYASELVKYVDNQMNQIAKLSPGILTSSTKSKVAVLACLNVAEELFKERRHWREKTQHLTEVLEKTLKKQLLKKKQKTPPKG
jgi:cell division protein ZapA (FtsZ GTPase activity inhibitor)